MKKQPSKNGKIIGGIVLICIGFVSLFGDYDSNEKTVALAICALLAIIGIILILVGLRTRKKYVIQEKKEQELEEARIRTEKARLKAEEARYNASYEKVEASSNATWVCKQCGATTRGNYCEFCGSAKE